MNGYTKTKPPVKLEEAPCTARAASEPAAPTEYLPEQDIEPDIALAESQNREWSEVR